MTEVAGFEDLDKYGSTTYFAPDTKIGAEKLGEREDKETIQKSMDLSPRILAETPRSSSLDLDEKDITQLDDPSLAEYVQNLPSEEQVQLKEELDKMVELNEQNPVTQQFTPEEMSFIMRFREIIAKAFEQEDLKNQKDRVALEKLKIDYKDAVKNEASFMRKMGTAGLIISCVAMGIFCFGLRDPANQGAQKVFDFAANQFSNGVGNITNQRYSARQTEERGRSSLALNQLQNEQQKKTSEGGVHDRFANSYKEALDTQRAASRSGG